MSLTIIVVVALAWCAWLVFDAVQECRRIDAEGTGHRVGRGRDGARPSRLADCLEVRG